MNFIVNFLKGLFIGIGSVMPGVSGGSLAVIFGLYEKITDLIANVFKHLRHNFKKTFIFCLPLGLGGIVGVLGFSKIIDFLFSHYEIQVKYLFIGLIIGTLPLLVKQSNKEGFKKSYLVFSSLSLAVTVFIALFAPSDFQAVKADELSAGFLAICGMVLGFGTIIPGVSASIILMYLGSYQAVLSAIANLDFKMLIPIGVGFALSIVLFAKLINLLFKKAYGAISYTILGFVIGSIIPVFPGFAFSLEYFICVILLACGFVISYALSNIKKSEN
ncbi:MAG: DUF368 domain-containing protein [Eubacteriales bacterium]|jgi:putative membrane protein|nr:DUF368 domain-containing protein [Eubacteriales bacterium]